MIPIKFRTFPSFAEVSSLVDEIMRRKKARDERYSFGRTTEGYWVSKRAQGTPAHFEALFLMIERGEIDSRAFKYGLKYSGVNEDLLFDFYGEWLNGKVHPKLKDSSLRKGKGFYQ